MDLIEWVEEAESLLRRDGLWPERDEERARGVLEEGDTWTCRYYSCGTSAPAGASRVGNALNAESRSQ